jgi:Tau95 Triple barrel domain
MTSEPAPKHLIPNTEYISIEYPGKVQNHERAFENLGGIQLLEKVRRDPSTHRPARIARYAALLTLPYAL